MTNEFENDIVIAPSNEESKTKEIKLDMMRYRANSLSYWLGFGAIGFSVFAAFVCLNSFEPNSVLVILKILLNVIILLFGFLSCEKAKAYSKEGSIALIAIGGVCAARIFWVPLQLMIYFNKYVPALEIYRNDPEDTGAKETVDECLKYLGKTITDYYNGDRASIHWLPANGNFRGIFAMVLLACAAALFIAAGVYGLIKSKRLATHLSSINKGN